jgi:Fe-S-cluster formation regulator IscX/YfhJ
LAFLPALLAQVDGLVLTTSCDQLRRASEWLNDNARVFLFNFPSTLHQERLLEAEKARLLKWIGQLPQASNRSKRCNEAALDARNQGWLDARRGDEREKLSIGVLGGHFCGDQQSVARFFEKRGLHVSLWGCEGGEWVGDVFQRPNDAFYEQVQARIAERHLDGLIVVRTTWCDVWRLACVRLHEVVKVPVLEWVMDGQFQGQSFPDGASTTRLEAFCELVRARSEEGA